MITLHPSHSKNGYGSVVSYTFGFLLSILSTLCAFWIAPSLGPLAGVAIISLAIIQLSIQLIFFLHIGRAEGPNWNLGMAMFTLAIIGILVIGTVWIMNNLAHLHMNPPTETDLYKNGVVAPQNELK